MIDKKKISAIIERGAPVSLKFKFYSEADIQIINSILYKILNKFDLLYLLNTLSTIGRELIDNVFKANLKRVYFEDQNLDINNPEDYKKGMGAFTHNISEDTDNIKELAIASDYYYQMVINYDANKLVFKFSNNSSSTKEEEKRIHLRIDLAKNNECLLDIFDHIQDKIEGGGVGIALSIFLLKEMGADPSGFQFKSDEKSTVTIISIPKELKPIELTSQIKKIVIEDIESIPTFPEHITELLNLCNDPEASIDTIAELITKDPALSAEVVKISNSAGFITAQRIYNIHDAVITIGLKNLYTIVLAGSARKMMNERYSKFEEIWEHCNRTAFYARSIAKNFKVTNKLENVTTAGLLHDLGKIVLLSAGSDIMGKIASILDNKNIEDRTLIEEASIGIGHNTIGSHIARKWNFPDYLIETIHYHHSPFKASDEFLDIVSTVYLANILCGIEKNICNYHFIDEPILKRFKFKSIDVVENYHNKLKDQYQPHIDAE